MNGFEVVYKAPAGEAAAAVTGALSGHRLRPSRQLQAPGPRCLLARPNMVTGAEQSSLPVHRPRGRQAVGSAGRSGRPRPRPGHRACPGLRPAPSAAPGLSFPPQAPIAGAQAPVPGSALGRRRTQGPRGPRSSAPCARRLRPGPVPAGPRGLREAGWGRGGGGEGEGRAEPARAGWAAGLMHNSAAQPPGPPPPRASESAPNFVYGTVREPRPPRCLRLLRLLPRSASAGAGAGHVRRRAPSRHLPAGPRPLPRQPGRRPSH
ncbi:hypothetical protein VULLAG_LOCUS16368 [Vulpes lagopus]